MEVLGDLVNEDVRRVSIDAILKAVAHEYRVNISDLKGPRRHRNITVPRQVGMYLVRELTEASLPQIGNAFGGRDHTTVLASVRKIQGLVRTDASTQAILGRLEKALLGE